MDVNEELNFLCFCENSNKKMGGRGVGGRGWDGRGWGSGWGGVRVDVNEELKFLCFRDGVGGQGGCERKIEVFWKIHKKKFGGVGRGGVRWGLGGGSGWWGGGGQGECERRIEVFVFL